MADSDLTTAATAASVLGVSAADPNLPRLIGAASESIRRYIDRPQLHYGAAIVEKLAGYAGQVRLHLGVVPLISVTTLVLPDETSLDSDDYSIEDLTTGTLYREEGWPFTGINAGGVLFGEAKTIIATYAGGWVTPAQAPLVRTLPYDIEECCLQAVSAMYRRQGTDPLVASESLGDYSVTFRDLAPVEGLVPAGVLRQLSSYRRLRA